MRITVDASVAVKWFAEEARRPEARLTLEDGLECHAPDFLLTECANVFWKKSRRGEIGDPSVLLQELLDSGIPRLHPSEDLLLEATRTARRLAHPVYDCLYVVCAQRTHSALVTDDRRLARAVAQHLPELEVLNLQDRHAIRRLVAAAAPEFH